MYERNVLFQMYATPTELRMLFDEMIHRKNLMPMELRVFYSLSRKILILNAEEKRRTEREP
jgi:hypothetical protein